MDFLRGAAKAVWAAVGPAVILLVNDLADIVETQVGSIVAVAVGTLLVYFVPNRGPQAPE